MITFGFRGCVAAGLLAGAIGAQEIPVRAVELDVLVVDAKGKPVEGVPLDLQLAESSSAVVRRVAKSGTDGRAKIVVPPRWVAGARPLRLRARMLSAELGVAASPLDRTRVRRVGR